jgi:23S rRNA (cytosine1962-C5)-methyltransferase
MTAVRLRAGLDRRARSGHLWIFSNELDVDVAKLPPGGVVDVFDAKGGFVGRGLASPHALLTIRLYTRDRDADLDGIEFWTARLGAAAAARERLTPGRRSGRLVHAEGDGLPGLVVDRHYDVLAVQLGTVGLDARRDLLAEAARRALSPRGAVLRNDGSGRALEGLPDERAVWFGEVPDVVTVDEFGVKFAIAPLSGQKTGHFYDQAENRRFFGERAGGARVLDLCCHDGAFALHALVGGAASAVAVDRSEEACVTTADNAALNGVADRIDVIKGDARAVLDALAAKGARFDLLSVDPPAFAKSKKATGAALVGYRDLNAAALRLAAPGAIVATSSCSHHVYEDRFLDVVLEAAQRAHRDVQLIRRGEQAPDHPVNPAVPESRYLKHLVLRVL